MKAYLAALLLSAGSITAGAQSITWSPPATVAMASDGNQHPRIQLDGSGNPLVLWGSESMSMAYFSRWNGSSFGMPVMMGSNVFTADWAGPDMTAHGDTVYVVYKTEPESSSPIYLQRSVNGGVSFGAAVQVDNIGMAASRFPTVTTDAAGQPVVAFMKTDMGMGNDHWVVARSADFGATFTTDVSASMYNGEPVCNCCPASIIASGSNMAMLYRNNWSDKRTIWSGLSTNSGTTFPTGMETDNTNWNIAACPSSGPDGVIIGDTLYATFMSGASGTRVYHSKNAISSMWSSGSMDVTPGATMVNQNYPRMASDGISAAIVWRQSIMSSSQMVSLLYTPDIRNGFPASTDTVAFSTTFGDFVNADVAIKGNAIHVVWQNNTTGTIRYSKGTISATGVSSVAPATGISIMPVPANGMLQVAFDKALTHASTAVVMDVTGRMVYQAVVAGGSRNFYIPTASLANGSYVLLATMDGENVHQKFVVAH